MQNASTEQAVTNDPLNKNIHYKGIVLWTDGGARPNPGSNGWGAHGYQYTTEIAKVGTGLASHITTAEGYLSSSQKGKTEKQQVSPQKYYDFFGSSSVIASNNAAEVDALYFSLEKIKNEEDIKKIQIYTDSEYLRRGLQEWVQLWERRGWVKEDGNPISNAENWKRLVTQTRDVESRGIDFKINWVKGHSDNFGNNLADRLATIGVMHAMDECVRAEFKTSPSQGYWKNEVERHPFIHFKRLYFNSSPEYNINGHYYLADPGGEDSLFCKRVPEAAFSVLKLKTPDPVIEKVKYHQYDVSNAINSMMLMRLDKVFTSDVYKAIEEHGKYAMSTSFRNSLGIEFLDRKPITVELNPAGLSLRSIEIFGLMDELLDKFESHQRGEAKENRYNEFTVHDITSSFFTKTEKVKKKEIVMETTLRPDFVVGFKDLMVEVSVSHGNGQRDIKVPLVLGLDLPPRNALKRMENQDPKIYLLTWKETEDCVRFACVAEMQSGIGIWSNYFADKIFLGK